VPDPTLEQIYNYRLLTDRIATAGQPTEGQLASVATAGFEVVINLARHGTEYALPDERATVEALGMVYEHIPVEWESPALSDLEAFFSAMQRHSDRRVFVHCVANMRVSAFMMLYRVLRLGWEPEEALPDMRALWEPEDVWKTFIEMALRTKEA
jgi:protein tyrosine phosphatase (PTP) superfamily phosphohydrolase (DUF442 family)